MTYLQKLIKSIDFALTCSSSTLSLVNLIARVLVAVIFIVTAVEGIRALVLKFPLLRRLGLLKLITTAN